MDTPVLPHVIELDAVMDEIAALEQARDAIPPKIFVLRQRLRALRLYALTLPQGSQAEKEVPHGV